MIAFDGLVRDSTSPGRNLRTLNQTSVFVTLGHDQGGIYTRRTSKCIPLPLGYSPCGPLLHRASKEVCAPLLLLTRVPYTG